MKIDRGKASHWLYLLLSGINVLAALALRWLPRCRGAPLVLLYGHKLNGNLAALLEQERQAGGGALRMAFLTMDPAYHRELRRLGEDSVLATSPRCIPLLARAEAVVSDHGLHVLELLQRCTRMPFFDVWHGIPFKGFDAADFSVQHRYREAWVASPLLRDLYVDRFGFEPGRVHATGYARTDRLVRRDPVPAGLRERLGLGPDAGRIILFAPTWAQDVPGRNLYPFGTDAATFLGALSALGQRLGATFLVRAHLNSGEGPAACFERVVAAPFARFPETEEVLLLSDALVCDWSSIAFDYLLLDRPTLFLDVEPPFAKGLSLGREFRFGAVVPDMAALIARLEQAITDPGGYHREFAARHAEVRQRVYGGLADGRAAERCLERLRLGLARA